MGLGSRVGRWLDPVGARDIRASRADIGGGRHRVDDRQVRQPPDNIDPAVTVTNNSWTASYPAYERLVPFNGGSTDIAPEVTTSWTTSADMLT